VGKEAADMAVRDDLDALIDDISVEDPSIRHRVDAALQRRALARDLADRRRAAGLTQAEIADRMGTSQGQIARFESGADTRVSTVGRYASALGVAVTWTIQTAPTPKRPRRRPTAARRSSAA
jgi:ribosome-binding protein aMBF1 (putative translation factor)